LKKYAGPVGFEPTTYGLGGPRNQLLVSRTSGSREIDWDGFRRYVYTEYSQRHAKDLLLYAKKFGHYLTKEDLSPLLQLSHGRRRHVLMALSALSKYLGIHDEFRRLREKYGIKWSVKDGVPTMLLDQNSFTGLLIRARETLNILSSRKEVIMFLALSGLRVEEALAAVKIFHEKGKEGYLNEELGVLEHYRFPEVFIRRTKNAYITVVDDYMLNLLERVRPTSSDSLRQCFKRKSRSKCSFHAFRKIWATYMRHEGIEPEVIDLLQGRVSRTVFVKYYYRPDLKPLLEKVRTILTNLRITLENG